MKRARPRKPEALSTVVVVGLGNIGSQTVDALGRIPGLKRVILVDPDYYSESNLASQRILRRDLNKAKVHVQARRLSEINPGLEVIPVLDSIANVPRGWLRGCVMLTALHSAAARRDACEAAWRMGATVVDGGVDPELGLGRVTVYAPAPDAPCFECSLEEDDYQAMPVRHLCGADAIDDAEVTATNGSPSLGAFVGALAVIEVEKLLAGQLKQSLAGRQLVVDLTHHNQYVTRLDRHSKCRCRFDHAIRDIQPLRGITERSTLSEALRVLRKALSARGNVSLGVDGHEFAKALHCPGCGGAKELLALAERLPRKARLCGTCAGREMIAVGFKKLARINDSVVPSRLLRCSLRQAGVRAGDVLVAGDETREGFFEVSHD